MTLNVGECHGANMSFDILRKTKKTRDTNDGLG